MKLISGIIGFGIALLALCFALSNRQTATISLWPFDAEVQAPLYLMTLGTLLIGLMFGSVVTWLSMIPHRLRTHRLHKDIKTLNQKIIDLQQTVLVPHQEDKTSPASMKSLWRFWGPR